MNRSHGIPIPIPIASMNETFMSPYSKKFVSEMAFRRENIRVKAPPIALGRPLRSRFIACQLFRSSVVLLLSVIRSSAVLLVFRCFVTARCSVGVPLLCYCSLFR